MRGNQTENHIRINQVILTLLVASLVSIAGLGQTSNAIVSGTVKDQSSRIIPGVGITITNTDKGTSRTTVSDDEGRYTLPELAPGTYQIAAGLTGFQSYIHSGIILSVGQHAVVNVVLSVGQVQEQVVVSGVAPVVNTETSTMSGLVDQKQIADLPLNGRSIADLVSLEAGTAVLTVGASNSASGFGRKISISGGRPSDNAFLLDGNFVNDTLNNTPGGASGLLLGVETLREFRVLTSTYNAEYGQSSGGIINAVTKSGTNSLHGSLLYFFRSSAMDARNFFDRDPNFPIVRSDPPPFTRHQFAATAGGPIIPNKTFIFGGYEGLREGLGLTRNIGTLSNEARAGEVVPLAPGIEPYFIFYPEPNRGSSFPDGRAVATFDNQQISNADNFVIKVDHNFSDSDTLFVRYTFDDARQQEPKINYATVFDTRNQYVTIEEKHIFSPKTLNVLRVGYNRSSLTDDDENLFQFPTELQLVPPNLSAAPELGLGKLGTFTTAGLGGLGGEAFSLTIGTGSVVPRVYHLNLFEYSDTLTHVTGPHSLKFGANIKRVQANMISPQRLYGSLSFDSATDFLQGISRQFQFIQQGSDVIRGMRFYAMGFFVQDDIQLAQNLNLNLGIRYEPSTEHGEVNKKLANIIDFRNDTEFTPGRLFLNPTKNNWAPRIGMAWDPFGDGKTAIRWGFGLFYNIQMAEIDRISATSNPPFATIGAVGGPIPFPFNVEDLPTEAATPALELIDYHAPQPYRMQWNLNLQRELFPNATVKVGYVGARGVDLFRVYQANQPDPSPIADNPDPSRSRFFFLPQEDRDPACAGTGCRLNEAWQTSLMRSGGADSYYHSLQVGFNKRFSDSWQVQAAYTYSKSLDTSSKQIRGPGESAQVADQMNPLDTASERGFSNFDVPNVFTLNFTWDLPGQNMTGAAGAFLGGWEVNGILTAADGVPDTIIVGFDRCRCLNGSGLGARATDNRPDLIEGRDNNPVLFDGREPTQYFNPLAFAPSTIDVDGDGELDPVADGFYGNLGRNTLRIPGVAQVDFSLNKRFRMTERADLQFRAEFFNIFNRANFADPVTQLYSSEGSARRGDAGTITRTTTTSRQIQFGLKVLF